MSNYQWWQGLVETALLGTERRPFETGFLPPDLHPSTNTATAEQAILEVAALAANYRRAGSEPLPIPLPDPSVCLPEITPYAPKAAMAVLVNLIGEQTPNRRLLEKWVQLARQRGWIVPPNMLVDLLSRQKKGDFDIDQTDFWHVLGNRGQWLCQFNPDWQYAPPPDPEVEFWEATGISRAMTLHQIRKTQPEKGRNMLQAAWPQETLPNRKQLLNALIKGLSADDIPFLNELRAELMAVRKPKPTQIEHYEQVTQLLMRIPGSPLFDDIVSRLHAYVVKSEKGPSRLVLPTAFDAFFAVDPMKQLGFDAIENLSLFQPQVAAKLDSDIPDGLHEELNALNPESMQILVWFLQLIMNMHPSGWARLLGEGIRPVPFFMSQPWIKNEEDGMVRALETMIITFSCADWVTDLVPYKSLVADWPKLLNLLPQPAREAMLMEHLDLTDRYGAFQFLTEADAPAWSRPFSEWVLVAILKTWSKQPYLQGAERQFFRDAMIVIDPAIRAKIDMLLDEHVAPHQRGAIYQQIIDPLNRWLALRVAIENL